MPVHKLEMNKTAIDQVVKIRSRIKAEFGERLLLSDQQLVATLKDYHGKSISAETRSLISECVQLLTGEKLQEAETSELLVAESLVMKGKPKRIYRGQVIWD